MLSRLPKFVFNVLLIPLGFVLLFGNATIATANESQVENLTTSAATLSQQGNIEQAIKLWQQEAKVYKNKNQIKQEVKVYLNIAQGYIELGNFDSAINQLNQIFSLNIDNSYLTASVWEKLGNSYSGKQQYNQAITAYRHSLKLNKSLSCLNNLVKTWQDLIEQTNSKLQAVEEEEKAGQSLGEEKSNYQKQILTYKAQALANAKEAVKLGQQDSSLSAIIALINWHGLSHRTLSHAQIAQAQEILTSQSPSRLLVFALVNWSKIDFKNKGLWLLKAEKIAQLINDQQAISQVALELGYFYQKAGKLKWALQYSQKVQLIGQAEFLSESLFKAYWLTAKIYNQQNKYDASIAAYKNALATLDTINQDWYLWNLQDSINYQLEIKPVYHELIQLFLEKKQVNNDDISQALLVADKQRVSELQNFFGDNCFQFFQSKSNEKSSSKEVLIYSIILENKTYIILKLPNGSFYLNRLNINQAELKQLAINWQNNLENGITWEFQVPGKKLYDLLIRPFEQKLIDSEFETLVFIHDGILRNLPMAALFDGKQYLAEKWASVSSLGLDFKRGYLSPVSYKALIFGLSHPQQPGWSALKMIPTEVDTVYKLVGGKKYLDAEFTVNKLTQELEQNTYSVIHLATHGYFAGNTEDSFLLAYDSRISILDLEKMLRNQTAIDLLVLSACETARGSDRSLLGLAGVAARSGVRSTLGSLWQVEDDVQSNLINEFYKTWQSSKYNKATALQKIQIEQIKMYTHPQKWAALILIGDYR
ncbi:MAG: CHAT domain-containing protein [Waterburya sp.]